MQEELPPYDSSSLLPGYVTCRDLTSQIDTTPLLPNRYQSQAGEYHYKSDHLHLNLGPRRWGTRFPVYGLQSAVEGTVRFTKKCSHVVSVTATVSPLWPQPLHLPSADAPDRLHSLKGLWRLLLRVGAALQPRQTKLSCPRVPSSSRLSTPARQLEIAQSHLLRCPESPSTFHSLSQPTSQVGEIHYLPPSPCPSKGPTVLSTTLSELISSEKA